MEPAPLHPPVPGRRRQQVGVGGRQVAGDDHVGGGQALAPASTTPVTPPGPPSTRSTRVEYRNPAPAFSATPARARARACMPPRREAPRWCPCGRPRRRCRGRRTATGRCRGPGRCGRGAAASRSGGWRPGCAAAGTRRGGPAGPGRGPHQVGRAVDVAVDELVPLGLQHPPQVVAEGQVAAASSGPASRSTSAAIRSGPGPRPGGCRRGR